MSPNIKSILLTSKESNSADIGDDWEAAGLASSCMLSHLEYIEIKECKDVIMNSSC
ncbi:hypothetical protein C5167_029726 [Papaver somniferum]|nr:hypothetical protein C5167_029725 [Papaver somniferum]RZC90595.1 hypothetical protein C5167_029726 [Papaver somniferum]